MKINEKKATWVIIILAILVPLLVSLLFFKSTPQFKSFIPLSFFPKFHAILNTCTALLLCIGLYFIKNKNIKAHKICNLSAFCLSAMFLVSYVTYHSLSSSTHFGGEGIVRYIYFILLISHIFLAAAILPLILFTFLKALNGKIEQHRKLAKWTFPLWLYVAISGVIIYFMISPYYIYN
jgi:putative membrane protein